MGGVGSPHEPAIVLVVASFFLPMELFPFADAIQAGLRTKVEPIAGNGRGSGKVEGLGVHVDILVLQFAFLEGIVWPSLCAGYTARP